MEPRALAVLSLTFPLALFGCGSDASNPASPSDGGSTDGSDAPSSPGNDGGSDARPPPGDAAADEGTDAPSDVSRGGDVTPDAMPDGAPPPAPRFVYVGGDDKKIHLYGFDLTTAALTPVMAYDAGDFPSFLAFDVAHHHVFATNENANMVAAFTVDPMTGALTANGSAPTDAGPTHVSVDPSGRFVFTGNYTAGTAQVFPVMSDGSLGGSIQTVTPGALTHCVALDPSHAYGFAVSKGADLIAQYTFDGTSGMLTPNATAASVATASGAGPRHIVFHPSLPYAYVIAELDSTMTTYAFDATTGTLAPKQTLSTVPSGFTGTNTGAEVQIAPSGLFLYGSNRGADDIVTFAVDPASGQLSLVAHTSTGGQTPRHFSLDPTGQVMLVANQTSGNVVTFRVDAATGGLTMVGSTAVGASPYFVAAVAP